MSTNLQLSDLVGSHTLTGVDTDPRESQYRMADCIAFTLDKKTYLAVEDQNDGYRSSMESIKVVEEPTKNRFKGVKVLARMSDFNSQDILQLLHAKTGKVILEVGTDNVDDYYPSWVARYNPENL